MEHLNDWLTLSLTPGLGPAGCKRLVDCFGSPESVLAASPRELINSAAAPNRKVCEAIGQQSIRDAAALEIAQVAKAGITLLCWNDENFPEWLLNIPDPPVLLYVKGNCDVLNLPGVSIVGSRAASSYGLKMAGYLAGQLVGRGLTVISGLALGIDAAAHQGALAAGGKTIGVLGCGLDVIYPAQNRKLFATIPEKGAIVSEYPLGTGPDGFRFPARNRIISGLSRGVVVVEASPKSGSLITASLALDQGREVFAVPGRADSIKSAGTHRLLQAGAKLVLDVNDITSELLSTGNSQNTELTSAGAAPGPGPTAELNNEEKMIMDLLEVYPKTVDDVIVGSNLPVERVNEILLILELKGLCEVLPGRQYQSRQQRTENNT